MLTAKTRRPFLPHSVSPKRPPTFHPQRGFGWSGSTFHSNGWRVACARICAGIQIVVCAFSSFDCILPYLLSYKCICVFAPGIRVSEPTVYAHSLFGFFVLFLFCFLRANPFGKTGERASVHPEPPDRTNMPVNIVVFVWPMMGGNGVSTTASQNGWDTDKWPNKLTARA